MTIFSDLEYDTKKIRNEIQESLKLLPNVAQAKNAILFLGDGMGIQTMTAGRILSGGENHVTNMDALPYR